MSQGLVNLIFSFTLLAIIFGFAFQLIFSKKRNIRDLLRRGQGYRSRQTYDMAIGCYQRVIELDAQNKTAIEKQKLIKKKEAIDLHLYHYHHHMVKKNEN